MITESQNPQDRQSQELTRCGTPEAFCQEVELFRPSPALKRMNELLSAIPVDLKKLGAALQGDPQLALEVVKFSNSSLFGLPRPVASLEQAVVATGSDMARTLLLTCWLTRLSGNQISVADNQLFWSHGLNVARISRRVGEWMGLAQPELAFLAGLLHDIGDLPMLAALAKNGAEGPQSTFEDLGESLESQRRRFGTDHCELGGRLVDVLAIPLLLAEVIVKHHHRDLAKSGFPLLPIVGAAEAIAQASRLCTKQELPPEALGGFVADCLAKWLPGLDRSAGRHLVEELESDLLAGISHAKPGVKSAGKSSPNHPGTQACMVKSATAGS